MRLLTGLLLATAFLTAAPAGAEGPPRPLAAPLKSQLALDLGGEGLAAAVSYENVVLRAGGRHRVLLRAGLGYLPLFVDGEATAGNLVVPVGARYLLGFGTHHLELGLSVPLRFTPGGGADPALRPASLSWVPSVGWRWEDFDGGPLFVGVAYAPRITYGVLGLRYGHWARVSFGVRL